MKTSTPTTTWDALPHDWQVPTPKPGVLTAYPLPKDGKPFVLQLGERQEKASEFQPIENVLRGLEKVMRYKNGKYGNSALSEAGVLSKASALEKLLARADDKIARIRNSEQLQRNDVIDLAGYLVLICAKQGWDDFTDLCD